MTNSASITNWLTQNHVTKREDLINFALLAKNAERFGEMAEIMRSIAMSNKQLNTNEKNMLSVSYKNIVGALRSAWRVITKTEIKEDDERKQNIATLYRQGIEEELRNVCQEVLNLMAEHLIKNATDSESRVYYMKMMGDYNRYLSEVVINEERRLIVQDAEEAYARAAKLARNELSATNPVRLGLALNHAVFHYEIKNNTPMACQLARIAFDEAEEKIRDSTDKSLLADESSFKDTALIMQLLKDNLKQWTSEQAADDVDSDDPEAKF